MRGESKKERQAPLAANHPPHPPAGARDKDQINLADEESRIMKVSGGGFEQCYNGPIAVDMESLLIVKTGTCQAGNARQQVEPMPKPFQGLPVKLGAPTTWVTDAGYYSEANVNACGKHPITPLIAVSREAHHGDSLERFTGPPPLAQDATPVERMRYALKTKAGLRIYAKRKCTVEPVIGIVKSVGFRQFPLRGLGNVKGELNLVSLAWNLKRMFVLIG